MSRHAGYPLPWSVQTWLPGTTASHRDPAASVGFARDLAAFIAEVRTIAVGDRTFSGSGRSGHLPSHDAWMDVCFAQSEAPLDVGTLRRLCELPRTALDAMTHGDLMPGNVLVSDAVRLAGVLDVGQAMGAVW